MAARHLAGRGRPAGVRHHLGDSLLLGRDDVHPDLRDQAPVAAYTFGFDPTLTPGLNPAFIGNVLEHAVLPALALLLTTIGTWILTMRNNMVTTLAEDY